MSKKEILIIFVSAVLVTGESSVWSLITKKSLGGEQGFPLRFFWLEWGGGWKGPLEYVSLTPRWNFANLVFDFLFWFLVIFVIWKVIQLVKKKRV